MGISLGRPRFKPRLGFVEFVMAKVALAQIILWARLSASFTSTPYALLCHHDITLAIPVCHCMIIHFKKD
jgi:hypothetical protein